MPDHDETGLMGDAPVPSALTQGNDEDVTEANTPAAAASPPIPAGAPSWAAAMRRLTDYLVNDFGGGPRPWKLAWVIDFQKAGTIETEVNVRDLP